MSTGTELSLTTFVAWLPSNKRAIPRLPCDPITMRSQALAFAVSMIASAGKLVTCNVPQSTPIVSASARTSASIFAASSLVAVSYSSAGKLMAMVCAFANANQGSLAVIATTRAARFFANFRPPLTALAAISDPSVAIRICSNIDLSPTATTQVGSWGRNHLRLASFILQQCYVLYIRRVHSLLPCRHVGRFDQSPLGGQVGLSAHVLFEYRVECG